MAAKRLAPPSAEAIQQQGHLAKRRLLFANDDQSPETIQVHPRDLDQEAGADVGGAGVMVDAYDGVAAFATPGSRTGSRNQQDAMIREQDRFLPIANVSRIMKRVLPASGKVAKEAKECVQECVSEFISFVTSEASERCMHEKRKTINGEDILWAMQTLGFDPYVEPLKVYLSKYRLALKSEKNSVGATGTPAAGYSNIIIGDHDPDSDQEGKLSDGRSQTNTGGQLYLTQDDLILGASGDQRQVHLATGADGQLTIIEMRTDADGNVETGGGGTAITLPVLSGSTTGENGTQQYILTTLDQSAISGAGVQQFTIPQGAQLAFIPASGTGGTTGAATSQGIPVMFLDPATSGVGEEQQSSQQFVRMNASGAGGFQIIQVTPSTIGGVTSGNETGGNVNATAGEGH